MSLLVGGVLYFYTPMPGVWAKGNITALRSTVCYTTRMKSRRVFPLLLVVTLLAACAPSFGPKAVAIAARGAEVTLDPTLGARAELTYTLDDLGLDSDNIRRFMSLPLGASGTTTEISSTFALIDSRIPDGWKLTIHDAWLDESVVRGSFGRESTRQTVRITLAVVPKEGAVAGPYRIRTTLNPVDGRSSLITFTALLR